MLHGRNELFREPPVGDDHQTDHTFLIEGRLRAHVYTQGGARPLDTLLMAAVKAALGDVERQAQFSDTRRFAREKSNAPQLDPKNVDHIPFRHALQHVRLFNAIDR